MSPVGLANTRILLVMPRNLPEYCCLHHLLGYYEQFFVTYKTISLNDISLVVLNTTNHISIYEDRAYIYKSIILNNKIYKYKNKHTNETLAMAPNYHDVELRAPWRLLLNNSTIMSCITTSSRQTSISSRLVSIFMSICFIAMILLVSIWILYIRSWASILCRSTWKDPSTNLMIVSAIYVAFPVMHA